MSRPQEPAPRIPARIVPLTPDRWADLARLFGARGACGGCWCMWWRLPRAQFEKQKGDANRAAFERLVSAGAEPGLIAYSGGEPAGWCSVAPREEFVRLEKSRSLARVDAQPVWSVTCLFIARPYRRRGLSVELLKAASKYAAARGARILEGYPVEPKKGRLPDAFAWTGLVSAFRAAGFDEAARHSASRPIMRRVLRRLSV
jgi:GNAT superfamily N-acetyltransferase